MSMASNWPVPVACLGRVAAGTVLWRLGGQLMVTTIVKATFGFVHQGDMVLLAPEPVVRADEHEGGHPMRSLRRADETAPQLQLVDVMLTGHAVAAGAASTRVRLAIHDEAGAILDKSLLVCGDRKSPDASPAPFERLPLGYERAYGGIGYPDNPLGTGYGSCADTLANVTYPAGPARTAAFGPIPGTFPVRKQLLGTLPRRALKAPVLEIPDHFEWRYFQAAPVDQRIKAVRGGEWLSLDGLCATEPALRTRLPRASAVTRVYGHAIVGVPDRVALVIDMLHVDADAERCLVVWRGSSPVVDETRLGLIVIAAGLEWPGAPLQWPASAPALALAACPPDEPGPPSVSDAERTTTYAGADASRFEGTVALDPTALPSAAHALPFAPGGRPAPAAPSGRVDPTALPFAPVGESRFEGTVALSPTEVATAGAATAPFDLAPVGQSGGTGAAVPGAPWSSIEPARPVTTPAMGDSVTVVNVDVEAVLRQREDERRRAAERREREQAEERERRQAEERERRQAEEQAEELRRRDEERFRAEQEQAKERARERAAAEGKEKEEAARRRRRDLYGGFRRRG